MAGGNIADPKNPPIFTIDVEIPATSGSLTSFPQGQDNTKDEASSLKAFFEKKQFGHICR